MHQTVGGVLRAGKLAEAGLSNPMALIVWVEIRYVCLLSRIVIIVHERCCGLLSIDLEKFTEIFVVEVGSHVTVRRLLLRLRGIRRRCVVRLTKIAVQIHI